MSVLFLKASWGFGFGALDRRKDPAKFRCSGVSGAGVARLIEEGRGRKTIEALKANPQAKSFEFQGNKDAPTEGDRCLSAI